jgi:hypothetical protein
MIRASIIMKTLLKDALPGAQTSLCKADHDARQ